MKKLLIFLLLLALGIGGYFLVTSNFLDKYSTSDPTSGAEVNKIAYVNTDDESNIAFVIKATNNESLVGLRENGELKTLGINTSDGRVAIVQLNDQKLPETLEFDGNSATFTNYTDSTVDITVNYRDGTTKIFEQSSILEARKLGIIPSVYALETQGLLHEAGIAVNVLGCGIGLGSLLLTAGATSPVAFLGCGALAVRIGTWNTEIGQCEGDFLQCLTSKAFEGEALDETIVGWEEIYDTFFPAGVIIKGTFKNSLTGSPIKIGTIQARDQRSQIRGEWADGGDYKIRFTEGGIYTIIGSAEGFKLGEFQVLLSDARIQIHVPGQQEVFSKALLNESAQEIETNFFIDPDAFIRGEIIDADEGTSIKKAQVDLLNESGEVVDSMETDSDGLFTLQPPFNSEGFNFTLRIASDDYKAQTIPMFVRFEVRDQSDEYDILNWEGIVKMKPGFDEWVMKTEYSTAADRFCKNMTSGYKEMVFYIKKNGTTGSEDEGLNQSLKGTIKNGKVDLWFDGFNGKLIEFKGVLGDTSGNGDWRKFPPKNVGNLSTGEKHHDTSCGGTWSASKK